MQLPFAYFRECAAEGKAPLKVPQEPTNPQNTQTCKLGMPNHNEVAGDPVTLNHT